MIYLLKLTSTREVSNFIECQVSSIKADNKKLRQALEEEFSDRLTQTGFGTAMAVKQGCQESPHQYYQRLFQAFFGAQNEAGMEEDLGFKSLFVRNLHPTTSCHLAILADPRTNPIKRLRELARHSQIKQTEAIVLNIETKHLPLELEGASHVQSGESRGPPPQNSHPRPEAIRYQPSYNHSGREYLHQQPNWKNSHLEHKELMRKSTHKVRPNPSLLRD